jgi:hypothetical protein
MVVRELDPSRDRLVVVTDETAPGHVKKGLVDAVDRLACLPPELPFAGLDGDADFVEARDVVLGHLRREWTRSGEGIISNTSSVAANPNTSLPTLLSGPC